LRLFTHQFRQEVAGLVLLDVVHPDLGPREFQLLRPPSPHESAALTAERNASIAQWTDPLSNSEGIDVAASAAQVRATGHFGQLPLVVITAAKNEWREGLPPDIARALEQDWLAMQTELAALSHNSTHIIATESDHAIQDCQPELVVNIIRQLVQEARA
jgi:hypothetical protein